VNVEECIMEENIRHVCGISGGKDSSAMAIYMRDKVPQMEYFFCDTGAELPETYEYLDKLEVALGKPIARLNSEKGFDHWFEVYRGTLPSPQMRWCTKKMKLEPIEDWLGDDQAISYVAIRSDESGRKGYVSTKTNIRAVFPFVEDGIDYDGVMKILENAGIGLPKYYEWRTRSGCYFCFYQRKSEWVGLADKHPELFQKAVEIESKMRSGAGGDGDASFSEFAMKGRQYTWSGNETLPELLLRRDEIISRQKQAQERAAARKPNKPIIQLFAESLDEEDDGLQCTVCAI